MKIAQFQKNSMIDFPGQISCVVYTQGCNMACEFCHNKQLIPQTEPENPVPWFEVIEFMKKRKGLVEAVVFSGGEPTIQPDLVERMKDVLYHNFKVGLHTNGTGPAFQDVAVLCDYILLSKYTPEKIAIAQQAVRLDLSEVLWDDEKQDWYNQITPYLRK